MTIRSEINPDLKSETDPESKYLSLREAARLYGYTRDHLGLMIRKNKLQGVRLGNYYATCCKWMDEYIRNYSDGSDGQNAKNKFSNKFRDDVLKNKLPPTPAIPVSPVKFAKTLKPKTAVLTELQKDVNQVLSRILSDELSPKPDSTEIKLADTKISRLTENLVDRHELIILPVRKMHDFERQIIITQAKSQRNR